MMIADPSQPQLARKTQKGRRNVPLDVLRAVAIVLVCGSHIEIPLPTNWTAPMARWWHSHGSTGVDLFFVLSGFLISGLIFDEFAATNKIRVGRFLARRALKLYPAYFVFIAYLIAMPVAKAYVAHLDWKHSLHIRVWKLVPNLLFVQNYWYDQYFTPMHTWSLAVEEHFYLVIPFVLTFMLRQDKLKWLFLLVLVSELIGIGFRGGDGSFGMSLRGGDRGGYFFGTHVRFTELLAGVGLRGSWYLWPSAEKWCKRHAAWLVLIGIFAFVVEVPAWLHRLDISRMEFASTSLIAGAVHLGKSYFPYWLHPFAFVPTILARIGFFSYSIYLWHITMGRAADKIMVHFIPSFGWFPCMITSTIFAILMGALLSSLIEYPVLRLRDRIWPRPATELLPGQAA